MADAAIAVMVIAFLGFCGWLLWLLQKGRTGSRPARRMTRRQAKVERYKADLKAESDRQKLAWDAKVRIAEAEARKWEAVRKTVEADHDI